MEKEIRKLVLLDEENWWGGISQNGIYMPYGKNNISVDLGWDLASNQGNPMLISSSAMK